MPKLFKLIHILSKKFNFYLEKMHKLNSRSNFCVLSNTYLHGLKLQGFSARVLCQARVLALNVM